MAKEWFSHDYGTRNKKKLAVLIEHEGSRGYGLFWIIVEMLYEARDKYLEIDEFTYIAIKKESKDDVTYIRDFIEKCIDTYKVFKKVKKKNFTTERVLENTTYRAEISEKRSKAGKESARARLSKATSVQHVSTSVEQNSANGNIGEDRRGNDMKGDEKEETIIFPIEKCLTIAMVDKRWVKANNTSNTELEEFNKLLEQRGHYEKNPLDYKTHFSNWKRTGKKSETVQQATIVTNHREEKGLAILKQIG